MLVFLEQLRIFVLPYFYGGAKRRVEGQYHYMHE